jgi:hypothetical protein
MEITAASFRAYPGRVAANPTWLAAVLSATMMIGVELRQDLYHFADYGLRYCDSGILPGFPVSAQPGVKRTLEKLRR